jgi:hypothetical protein
MQSRDHPIKQARRCGGTPPAGTRRTPSYVDVDYRNRLEPAEILAAIRSLDAVPQPQEDPR